MNYASSPRIGPFTLSRLSSLFGVLPLGWLWLQHLWLGSHVLRGPDALDAAVGASVESWPHRAYALAAHGLLLGIPLVFHATVGLLRFGGGRDSLRAAPTYRNWSYSALRWTGVLLLPFLLFHLFHSWWLVYVEWGGAAMGPHPDPERAGALIGLGAYWIELFARGFWVPALYLVGAAAMALHLAQGLWSAAINWGVVAGGRAMRGWSVVCAALFAGLFVLAMNIVAELIRLGGTT